MHYFFGLMTPKLMNSNIVLSHMVASEMGISSDALQ